MRTCCNQINTAQALQAAGEQARQPVSLVSAGEPEEAADGKVRTAKGNGKQDSDRGALKELKDKTSAATSGSPAGLVG